MQQVSSFNAHYTPHNRRWESIGQQCFPADSFHLRSNCQPCQYKVCHGDPELRIFHSKVDFQVALASEGPDRSDCPASVEIGH